MRYIIFFIAILSSVDLSAQTVLDKTIAKIGDEVILLSDLEYRYREEITVNGIDSREAKCGLFFNMVREKMLILQAARDSVEVTADEVDMQMQQRMDFFVSKFGSEKELEKYFNQDIKDIRAKLRESLKDQLLVQRMQGNIMQNLTVSPAEIKEFYRNIPKDSLPEVEKQYEIGQILLNVGVSKKEMNRTKRKLRKLKNEIENGLITFDLAARLYSQDPGSAKRGGDLGWANRDDFVPEFSAAAFKLKRDSISQVVQSEFGVHIIKLLNRKGERIHVKHILLKPVSKASDRKKTYEKLDSIRTLIQLDSFSFERAAYRYSDDKETRNTGGMLYDQASGAVKVSASSLDPALVQTLDTMKAGRISEPTLTKTQGDKDAFRIIYLKSKTKAHTANLKEDYSMMQKIAEARKKEKYLMSWTWKKAPGMYISIDENYYDCPQIKKLVNANKNSN